MKGPKKARYKTQSAGFIANSFLSLTLLKTTLSASQMNYPAVMFHSCLGAIRSCWWMFNVSPSSHV